MPIGGSTTSASRCQLAVCVDVQRRIIAQAGTSIDRNMQCVRYAVPDPTYQFGAREECCAHVAHNGARFRRFD